jgi:hypothetical protein
MRALRGVYKGVETSTETRGKWLMSQPPSEAQTRYESNERREEDKLSPFLKHRAKHTHQIRRRRAPSPHSYSTHPPS